MHIHITSDLPKIARAHAIEAWEDILNHTHTIRRITHRFPYIRRIATWMAIAAILYYTHLMLMAALIYCIIRVGQMLNKTCTPENRFCHRWSDSQGRHVAITPGGYGLVHSVRNTERGIHMTLEPVWSGRYSQRPMTMEWSTS